MALRRQPLADLLLEAQLVTQETLDGLDPSMRDDERRLGGVLVERKLVSAARLAQVVSHQMSLPWVSLEKVEFTRALLKLIPKKLAYKHHVIPVYLRGTDDDGTLYVATDDPTHDDAIAACNEACGLKIRLMVAAPNDVRRAIETHYGRRSSRLMPAVSVPVVGAAGLPAPEAPRRPPPPPVSMRQPLTPAPASVDEQPGDEVELTDFLDDDEGEAAVPSSDAVTAEPPGVDDPPKAAATPEAEAHGVDAPPTRGGDEAALLAMAVRADDALDRGACADELDDDVPFPEEPPDSISSEPMPELAPPSPPAVEAARRKPPVVLLVNPPPRFIDACAAIAATLPARVEAVSLSEANVRALATEPIVIVITDDVYEFDRLAFNQLAMAVRAPLVVWSEDLDPDDLEPLLAMAFRGVRAG